MTTTWEENFDSLLVWLDADRDKAGAKYEQIRESLINIFSWRGFNNAEDLTDETISRVATKVIEVVREYKGEPALYFYGVARNIYFEARRRDQKVASLTADVPVNRSPLSSDDDEPEYDCLDRCLEELPAAERELILLYYQQEQPKIRHRKELAIRLRVSPNGLRLRAHRIRNDLHNCIEKCLGVAPVETDPPRPALS